MSQLDLAVAADTTPRYVSFVETGRSRPGRDMVERLAIALDVPIRERNAMFAAAGLPPIYPARELGDQDMRPIKTVLDRILRTHEPYPAWVVGRGLRFLASNRGAETVFPGMCERSPEAIVDLWFGAGPFRDVVENWQDVIWAGIAGLRRELSRSADPLLSTLVQRAEHHARNIPRPDRCFDLPVICPRLRINGEVVRTISTVMRFDSAVEVTASELHIELLFPADERSDAFFQRAATAARA